MKGKDHQCAGGTNQGMEVDSVEMDVDATFDEGGTNLKKEPAMSSGRRWSRPPPMHSSRPGSQTSPVPQRRRNAPEQFQQMQAASFQFDKALREGLLGLKAGRWRAHPYTTQTGSG